ncbi:zinc finger CW-type PWWP domain protein 1 isoform X2 [Ornithorhynchus anatinus]|uniref:zinc finger CW-type PWWP domain protein 1 isoform X2 n=1 Tax=Ornithorhynchus anatinus TaxID=9258 RepID=UPI0010A90286|nr:zinc finger CW-type PWWP domain protein 1 isoform X2 [Ornithorhynchus anatinus]
MTSKDTTGRNKKEGGKGSKKTFRPPGNRPPAPVRPSPPQEGPRGDASPGKDAASDRARAGQPEKKEKGKMAKEQGPGGDSARGKKAGKEPEKKQAEPEKKRAEPEKKRAEPEKKRAEPEKKQVEPEKKRAKPGKKQAEPEKKQAEPEKKQAEPEKKRAEPEKKQVEPEKKQVEPEKKQVEPEKKRAKPGKKQVESEKKQVESEKKQAEPEKKQAEPEKKQVEPEKKQAEPKVKERKRLSDAEFEEIFQCVLQKSLRECLEASKRDIELEGDPEKTKEPRSVIAASPAEAAAASGGDGDDDEREMPRTPSPPETCLPQGAEDASRARSVEPGPPNSASAAGKSNQASADRKKKDTNGSAAPAKPERKLSRRGRPKKVVQGYTQVSDQEVAYIGQRRSFSHSVAWVQCSFQNCEKWRRLLGNIDPSGLPDNWECSQNSDLKYNRCDIPEEMWTGSESDVVYASYIPGSLVWAKQYGYPWWPGMVDLDPDLGEYFVFHSPLDSLPSKYHVTFLGEVASRAWISVHMLKNFQELSLDQIDLQKTRTKTCSQMLLAALKMAQEAEPLGVQERVSLFGFSIRYSKTEDVSGDAQDPQGEGKQDEHPKAKEDDEPHVMEEEEPEEKEDKEEEKRDLTQPKPAKIPKKEPRSQAEGKKNYKRPLRAEAAATPKATAGKRGRANPQIDLFGVRKAFSISVPRLPRERRGGVSGGRASALSTSAGARRERRGEAPKEPRSPLPGDDVDPEQMMEEVVDPEGELPEEEEDEEEGEEFSLVLLEE